MSGPALPMRLARGLATCVAAVVAFGPGAAWAQSPVAEVAVARTPASPPPDAPWLQAVSPDAGLPRPPPSDTQAPPRRPMPRRLDVGAGIAFLAKLADEDAAGTPTEISYAPTLGLEVHLRIPILENVDVSPYFLVAAHSVDIPDGGLAGVDGTVEPGSATALTFGARIARTFRVDPVRVWANAGIGYGRMEFGRMVAREAGAPAFEIRDRGVSFIEFPFGFGGAVEIVPGWVSLDLEAAAGPVLNKSGPATSSVRTIDGSGQTRDVGALPSITATFVGAFGFSVIL